MSDMQSEHSQARSGTQTHMQRSTKAAANVTAVYACFIWDPNDLDWCEAPLQNEFGYVWSVKDNPPAYTHTHTHTHTQRQWSCQCSFNGVVNQREWEQPAKAARQPLYWVRADISTRPVSRLRLRLLSARPFLLFTTKAVAFTAQQKGLIIT